MRIRRPAASRLRRSLRQRVFAIPRTIRQFLHHIRPFGAGYSNSMQAGEVYFHFFHQLQNLLDLRIALSPGHVRPLIDLAIFCAGNKARPIVCGAFLAA